MQTAIPKVRCVALLRMEAAAYALLAACALLIVTPHCWARQADSGMQPPNSVETLKRDSTGVGDGDIKVPSDLEKIAKAHDLRAVPALEEIFDQRRKQTLGIKALLAKIPPPPHQVETSYEANEINLQIEMHIASVLIRLGAKDDLYWNYLAEQTKAALEINMPFPMKTDAQEGPNPPENPKLLSWAKSRNLDQNVVAMFQLMVLPTPITFLASTGDPRGIPLLRQRLTSHNPLIQASAAEGLAVLRDNDSVPLIIATCKKVSASERTLLAKSLLYFDDPQAQAYAALYLPKRTYLYIRQRVSQGHTPFD